MRGSIHIYRVISVALIIFIAFSSVCAQAKSPGESIKAFFMLANEGKYSAGEKYLSTEALKLLKEGPGLMKGGTKGYMDTLTANGNIAKIEIISEQIRGEGATVSFKVHYKFKDGKVEVVDSKANLIKEDGEWKLSVK